MNAFIYFIFCINPTYMLTLPMCLLCLFVSVKSQVGVKVHQTEAHIDLTVDGTFPITLFCENLVYLKSHGSSCQQTANVGKTTCMLHWWPPF